MNLKVESSRLHFVNFKRLVSWQGRCCGDYMEGAATCEPRSVDCVADATLCEIRHSSMCYLAYVCSLIPVLLHLCALMCVCVCVRVSLRFLMFCFSIFQFLCLSLFFSFQEKHCSGQHSCRLECGNSPGPPARRVQ